MVYIGRLLDFLNTGSKCNYGQKKIKKALLRRKKPLNASRRLIGKTMRKYNLISSYGIEK